MVISYVPVARKFETGLEFRSVLGGAQIRLQLVILLEEPHDLALKLENFLVELDVVGFPNQRGNIFHCFYDSHHAPSMTRATVRGSAA